MLTKHKPKDKGVYMFLLRPLSCLVLLEVASCSML